MKKQVIRNANMAYIEEGQGSPILMGHSFLWDCAMWHAQTMQLKSNYRCIVPDLWSHGHSDPLPQGHCSIEALANDYWEFSQALSLEKFALMGLSVGGMWATQLALSHPENVTALILMDTYVGPESEIPQAIYLGLLDEMAEHSQITSDLTQKIAPYFFAKNTGQDQPHLVTNFINNLQNTPTEHISGKVSLGRAIFTRHSLLEKLQHIQIPTLVIVGEEDLPRPPHEAKEMADLIPNAKLEIIPKAGHICTVERPDYVNELISNFLSSVI